MVSKKDALILGIAIIGGLGAATMLAGDDSGGADARAIPGGILGAPTGAAAAAAPTVYQFAAQPAVTFPAAPTFDISKMFPAPPPKPDPVAQYYEERKGAGYLPPAWEVRRILARREIGKPSPATGVQPYVYTGGEVKLGAATPAPYGVAPKKEEITYAPAARLPAAIGVSTALKYARGTAGVSAAPKKEIIT